MRRKAELEPLYRNLLMRTRFTPGNIALLVIATLICVFDFSYIGLILASVHTPEKGWHRLGVDFIAVIAALAVVAILAGFRWPKLASTSLWTLTLFYFVLAVELHLFPVMVIPAVLLAVASALTSLVEHFSGKSTPSAS